MKKENNAINIYKASLEKTTDADKLLTLLIRDEKQYDDNINEFAVMENLYQQFYNGSTNCILYAESKGEVIGYLYGYINESGIAFKEKYATLDAMFVAPEYRHQGIGDALITNFKDWLLENNVKKVELKVCLANNNAIRLYQKHGFISVKTTMEWNKYE